MQYMCLIYSAEGTGPQPGTDAFGPFMKAYQDYTTEMRDSGAMVHADALQPIATATTVTVRDGKTITTDGPFAETKEQLGGYYLLECKDLDEAIAKAAKIPTATYGRIEIRPVVVWDS
ncbi:YciI family protein [Yoonia sp. SS1-5]|uniref:YciI family protein n=1 Tax=Yoonia rhodophyticola TaxID=3137370 RepID=A0AAN0NLX1_9RHOB